MRIPAWAFVLTIILIALVSGALGFFLGYSDIFRLGIRTTTTVNSLSSYRAAVERANQVRSVTAVIALGQCIDRYIQDNPRVGAPHTDSYGKLIDILYEAYGEEAFRSALDGWGKVLHYSHDPAVGSRRYTIESWGADGQSGPPVQETPRGELIVTKFVEDIIYSNGRLIQHPEGPQS